ncbi:AsmA-like C-terminal region-containing protein [Thermosulfurimonas sp. F29]|uniref:AsmA family protein n=1 Tax=Thermosulfurimonas sp. F29 TaxID=2867247 RepID=UPI001C83DF37|nr:AsmA-like C-terminal region-containing protein [Thermosulfurimonas sp. F29]MBX6422759.1 hypothetical protein [Thermosulfurimonas sp. F29]
MKRFLLALLILGVVIVGGAAFLVHHYLKPERIRPLVVRELERLSGRRVTLEEVRVGLFRGVYLRELRIKEEDGRTDFLRLGALRVRPSLRALLRGKVVLTGVRIEAPFLRVVRRKDGSFNWESLRFLARREGREISPGKGPSSGGKTPSGGRFLTLLVPEISVHRGRLLFLDRTGKLPRLDIPFDLRASLSPKALEGTLNFVLLGEPYALEVRVEDFRRTPKVRLRLTGKRLDVTPFLIGSSETPRGKTPGRSSRRPEAEKPVPVPPLPVGSLSAELSLDEVLYRRLRLSGVHISLTGTPRRLILEHSFAVAGGRVQGRAEADLAVHPPLTRLREKVEALRVETLLSGLSPDLPGEIQGIFSGGGNFTLRGLSPDLWPDTLSGAGVFALSPLKLSGIPATRKLSELLGLEELRVVIFDSVRGAFRVRRGRAELTARGSGETLSVEVPGGTVSFAGELDLPLELTLSPTLSKKLTARWPLAVNLLNARGEVQLTVHLKGPYRHPRLILRSRPAEERIREKLREILPPPLRGILPLR